MDVGIDIYCILNREIINISAMYDTSTNLNQKFSKFIEAIRSGSLGQVQQLLREDAAQLVNRIDLQFRQPSLYFASLASGDNHSAELIKLLMRNGANPHFKDHNGQTILFYICRQGKEICAEILLSHGLSLDEVDVYGQTPLFYAVSENRLEMVRKYSTKERVNLTDTLAGQSPIYYAAKRGHLQMAKLLIEKGADITATDSHNKTAVDYAKKTKFTETCQFLHSQLKKIKQLLKPNNSQEIQRKQSSHKKKQDILKQTKQVYKLVVMSDNGETRDLTQQQVAELINRNEELQNYLANPDLITQQQMQNDNESWDKHAMKILNACTKQKGAFYFMEPVDPAKFNIMDYFDIVTVPMDFGTIKKRLVHNFYKDASQFVGDMKLVWDNCYKYNGVQHIVSKSANEVENYFSEQVKISGFYKFLEN